MLPSVRQSITRTFPHSSIVKNGINASTNLRPFSTNDRDDNSGRDRGRGRGGRGRGRGRGGRGGFQARGGRGGYNEEGGAYHRFLDKISGRGPSPGQVWQGQGNQGRGFDPQARGTRNEGRGGRGGRGFSGRREGGRGGGGGGRGRGGKKSNFAKEFLEPAARGELKHHRSGIPKLAARKSKGHAVHDLYPGKEAFELLEMDYDNDEMYWSDEEDEDQDEESDSESSEEDDYSKKVQEAVQKHAGNRSSKKFDPRYNPYHNAHKPYGEQYNEHGKTIRFNMGNNRRNDGEKSQSEWIESYYFPDIMDFSAPFVETPEEELNKIVPLKQHGPELDDFLRAMIEHPTKYASVTYDPKHPESFRKAVPIRPTKGRLHPPTSWIKKYKGYIHVEVDDMPPVTNNIKVDDSSVDEPPDFQNPAHKHLVAAQIADWFKVETNSVFPSSMTSAFVGFSSNKNARTASRLMHRKKIPSLKKESESQGDQDSSSPPNDASDSPPVILNVFMTTRDSEFDCFGGWAKEHIIYKRSNTLVVDGDLPSDKFFLSHYDVVYLDNLPMDITKEELTAFFQPFCLEFRDVRGSIEFVKCSKGKFTGRAYVGFDQWGEADKVMEALLQKYPSIQETITTDDVEILEEESDAKEINYSPPAPVIIELRENVTIPVQKMMEKKLPRGSKLGPRPSRTEEEILDSLHNWEKFVDPAHLKELYDAGIKRDMLETAFLTMRYQNKSFGPVDLAMKGERLEPTIEIGSRYESAVRKYVKVLRQNLTSPENPGMFVETMFAPGETIDLSLIDGPDELK